MALQDILSKILEEADKEIAKINQDFEAKKSVLEKEMATEEKAELSALNEKTKEALNSVEEKTRSMARRENAKSVLISKRDLIKESLEAFLRSLEAAPDDLYGKIIEKLFSQLSFEKGELVVPEKREALMKKIMPQGFSLKTSKEVRGGFIAHGKGATVDNSFKNLVFSEFRNELEIYFANQLKLL